MRASFKPDEKQADEIDLTLEIKMKAREWMQVREALIRGLGTQYHITAAHFLDLVRGVLSAHHNSLNSRFEIDPYKIEQVRPDHEHKERQDV